MRGVKYADILLLFTTIVTVDGICPDGWISHMESCYLFSHDVESWSGALTMCNVVKGNLVEITDARENSYIYNTIHGFSMTYWWLGGNDLESEGKWMWTASRALFNNSYTNWHRGEPNDLGTNKEDCQHMYSDDGTWNDADCTVQMHYICEKSPILDGGEIVG